MFPPKTVDGSIEDWHNQNEGKGDQVWKQAFWSPERPLKLHPTNLGRRVEIYCTVPEGGEMYIMYILKPKKFAL